MRRKQFIPSAHIYTYSSEKETIVEIGFGIAIENSKIDIFFFYIYIQDNLINIYF